LDILSGEHPSSVLLLLTSLFVRHGIGHFLSVHEGPQRVGSAYNQYEEPLADGMFLSDEPGYYKAGDFGIRIEDDMEVVMTNRSASDSTQFLRFKTITMLPYERSLIDVSLLATAHFNAINTYHARVADLLEPLLIDDQAALTALRSRTAPLERPSKTVMPSISGNGALRTMTAPALFFATVVLSLTV
jgi:Xaa-Pro aminopeptidase